MRHGLVALGDSITKGEGNMALGVQCQSWALWLAQALALPFTGLAANGALSGDVVREQLPQLAGPYDLGCLYLGVNDARSPAWDAGPLRGQPADGAGARRRDLRAHPDADPSRDLGRPPAGGSRGGQRGDPAPGGEAGVWWWSLRTDLRGWPLVLPDAVHPTALGQLEIAERAAAALAAAGVAVPRRPTELAEVDDRRRTAARARAGWARMLARDLARRGMERIRPPAAP